MSVVVWGAGFSSPGAEDGSILARRRFLAMLGVVICAFLTQIILAQVAAILVVDPCLE